MPLPRPPRLPATARAAAALGKGHRYPPVLRQGRDEGAEDEEGLSVLWELQKPSIGVGLLWQVMSRVS